MGSCLEFTLALLWGRILNFHSLCYGVVTSLSTRLALQAKDHAGRKAVPSPWDVIIEPSEVVGLVIRPEERARRREKLRGELARAVDELKKMGAERIVLIGSMAEDNAGPLSDIDLLVVMRTRERFLDRLKIATPRTQPSLLEAADAGAFPRPPEDRL